MHIAGHLLQNDADSGKAKARLTHKPGDKGHWLGIRIQTDCKSLGLNQDPLCMCVCSRGRLHQQGEMHYSASDLATKTGTHHTCYKLFPGRDFFSSKVQGSHAAALIRKLEHGFLVVNLIRNLVYKPCRENHCDVQALLCILHIFLISSPVQHFCAA